MSLNAARGDVITYAVSHPAMSEPLIVESHFERTPRALAAHASMYILRTFDEMLPIDEFTVEEVPRLTES